jgi:hypothetical protein
LPPSSDEAKAALAAGCRDPLGFIPDRVAANADVTADTTLVLDSLPAADVMVGDVTARIAYGAFVLYDDRDGSGTLELSRPHRLGRDMMGPPGDDPMDGRDVVYATSFLSMSEPDTRLSFREGAYAPSAYYPRKGCGDPLPGYSIVSAGGFSLADAIAATAAGTLPSEDPATCSEQAVDATTVALHVRPVDEVREAACGERNDEQGEVNYREPRAEMPDLTDRTIACTDLASFGMPPKFPQKQLIVSGTPTQCKGLSHFVLRGCREDPDCAVPDWDYTATPPEWWPCE